MVVIPRIRNRGVLCTAAIPADFYRALRLPNNRASAPSSLPTESRISMTGWRSDKSAPEAPGQSRTHSAGSDPPARPRPGTNGRQRVCRAGSGSSLHSRWECPRLSRDLKDNGNRFFRRNGCKADRARMRRYTARRQGEKKLHGILTTRRHFTKPKRCATD